MVWPVSVYAPFTAGQATQVEAPPAEMKPAAQLEQLVEPAVAAKEPAAHAAHSELFAAAWKAPVPHVVHAEAPALE